MTTVLLQVIRRKERESKRKLAVEHESVQFFHSAGVASDVLAVMRHCAKGQEYK